MKVNKATHDRLKSRLRVLQHDYGILRRDWNRLIDEINSKGGRAFLDGSVYIGKDDIKRLLALCHPDKHNGKRSAVEMTQKLLALRDSVSETG